MIKKLKKKIALLTITSVFSFLLLILLSINISNFALVTKDADEITLKIANNRGNLNAFSSSRPGSMGPDSPETADSVRYFSYTFDENGNATKVQYRLNAYSEEECQTWATSLYNGSLKKGWDKVIYRYLVYKEGNNTLVIVIDQSRELAPSYNVLYASIIGSIIGLAVVTLVTMLLVKRFVKPIEESDNKQKSFIQNAALTLKTPITVISFDNSALEHQNGPSELNASISKQVEKLNDLANDLNALAMYSGPTNENIKEFNFTNVIKEYVSRFENGFESNNKTINLQLEENVMLTADLTMIQKMLFELIENSLKYADSRCDINLSSSEGRVTLVVENDCNGIPEGSLDRVFDRFYRLDYKDHSIYDGSGVGLSIVKEIVDAHRGRVVAKGENNRFIIKIQF